jgi:DNA polymerase IIIc chi subunit
MTQVTFVTNNDTTLAAIATQLATQFPTLIATAVRSGTRSVVITTVPGQTVVLASITVAA